MSSLDEIGHIGGQLLNGGVVEALHILQQPLVVLGDEVDGDSLAAEAAGAPDPVQVVLRLGGQVVVDDQRHLPELSMRSGSAGKNAVNIVTEGHMHSVSCPGHGLIVCWNEAFSSKITKV